jgi:Arc/MetJ family transcription regulator
MVTNIDIDGKLLEEAKSLGHHKTKKSAVNEALAEYVRVHKQRQILELFGTVDFDPDYDYKAERKRR